MGTRRTDCIYCGADTGSREHTFPAALGGRRVNKGILCGSCNAKFSPLDALLSRQLGFLNGVIGVRPDRADEPRPAQVDSVEGPLTLNHAGKTVLATPRVISEEPLPDGHRRMSIEFANERQAQEWIAQQRSAGLQVKKEQGEEGRKLQRFLPQGVTAKWSFGGNEAFREIGRIALNFLAHQWPDVARLPALKPFKHWVEGTRSLDDLSPRFVWYAPEDAFLLPDAAFKFGHQVLLSTGNDCAYGRVRFFSTFDLFVWFGRLPGVHSGAVIFDVDPLAESPRDDHDLRQTALERSQVPALLTPPISSTLVPENFLHERARSLLKRVSDLHWSNSTRGLLDSLNATRIILRHERTGHVAALLAPHKGRVLFLAQYVAEESRRRSHDEITRFIADTLESLLAPDPNSEDGLSPIAGASLCLAFASLADVISEELEAAPLTDERLRMLLAGGPGAHAVGRVLTEQIICAIKDTD